MEHREWIRALLVRDGVLTTHQLCVWVASTASYLSTAEQIQEFLNTTGVAEQIGELLTPGRRRALLSQAQLTSEDPDRSRLEADVQKLWELLDAISTLGDSMKPDAKSVDAYHRRVNAIADKRFEVRGVGAGEALVAAKEPVQPIPIRLHCPECRALHVDEGIWATKPHDTHACQECGNVWKPAKVPTVGVRFLPGYKNDE